MAETFTGTVLRHYEDELARVVALSFFIPLLIGTGGNSGSQTVTTIVRGLAVGEIEQRDFGRVFLREAGSGVAPRPPARHRGLRPGPALGLGDPPGR